MYRKALHPRPIYGFLPVLRSTSTSSLSLAFSWDAASAFLATLRILSHASKQLPALQSATLGIEKAASNMEIILPDEAQQIFAEIKRRLAQDPDENRGKSDWVVVFNTANSDVQASRLNNLVKELQELGLDR
jgi:hypothetical protein